MEGAFSNRLDYCIISAQTRNRLENVYQKQGRIPYICSDQFSAISGISQGVNNSSLANYIFRILLTICKVGLSILLLIIFVIFIRFVKHISKHVFVVFLYISP